MEEEVSILKALWSTRGPVHFDGRFHKISGAFIRPRPLQQPFPKFYLGGGSRPAWEMSAKHSDVHLFWGDLPEKIAANIAEIREMARAHDRHHEIGFGMRLQVICRENEADAWEAADQLVRHATERQSRKSRHFTTSRRRTCACSSLPVSMATCCCRICGPASPRFVPVPTSPSSAIPSHAPTRCSNSSMPAVIRSARPAI